MKRYSGIEPALSEANRNFVQYNRKETHFLKIIVLRFCRKVVQAMKKESPGVFAKFRPKIFGGGSSFEGLRVGRKGDFDVDILLTLPKETRPKIIEGTVPAHVQLQLQNFHVLEKSQPDLYRGMNAFVDDGSYLRADKLKSQFQSIFTKAMNANNQVFVIARQKIEIVKVQPPGFGPALTLNIEFLDYDLEIDLVPCILLTKNNFRPNPFPQIDDFFLVPKTPKSHQKNSQINRYFRLSFQKQERKIIHNKLWMKPAIRIMKLINNNFGHKISSYAIKTIFMLEHFELAQNIYPLDDAIPELWVKSFSFCLIHMLEKYLQCLQNHHLPYFWNAKRKYNLLADFSEEYVKSVAKDIQDMLDEIRESPDPETMYRFLETQN